MSNEDGKVRALGEFQTRVEGFFFHPGFSKDPDDRRRAQLLIWVCLLAGPVLLLVIIGEALFTQNYARASIIGVGHVVTCASPVWIRWSRSMRVPATVMTVLATLQLLSALFWTGGLESQVVGVLPLASIFLAMVGTIRLCLMSAGGLTLGLFGMMVLEQQGIRVEMDETLDLVRVLVASWAIATGLMFAWFNDRLNRVQIARVSEELRYRTAAQREAELLRDQWETFLNFVSHELRNPLTTISVSLELLEMDAYADRRERLLQSLHLAAKRLSNLADDVLDYSALERGHLQVRIERVNVTEAVKELIEEMAIRPGLEGRLSMDGESEVVGLCDAARLSQILENLIGNAAKYAPGSDIVVSVGTEGAMAAVVVSDQGPGVAEEVKDSLFEPFSRSQGNQASGHGLGLFISRQLARAMDGGLQLMDDPGPGARFRLQFPLA